MRPRAFAPLLCAMFVTAPLLLAATPAAATAAGTWGPATALNDVDSTAVQYSTLAAGPGGEFLAVWIEDTNSRPSVWSNMFTPGVGWGEPRLLESDDSVYAVMPQALVGGEGRALVLWQDQDPNDGWRSHLSYATYTPGVGWQPAARGPAWEGGDQAIPHLAPLPGDRAMAVWTANTPMGPRLAWDTFSPSEGWGEPELVRDTADPVDDNPAAAATDSAGNAVAVWITYNRTSGEANTTAAYSAAGSGWGPAEVIGTLRSNGDMPSVAFDAAGNAVVVFSQYNTTSTSTWAARFTPGAGWAPAERLSDEDARDAFMPQLAVCPAGRAAAVWVQRGDDDSFNITGARYDPSVGWAPAEGIDLNVTGQSSPPQVAADGACNFVVTWSRWPGAEPRLQSMALSVVATRRLEAAGGWGPAEARTGENVTAQMPAVAVDADGNVVVDWDEFTNTAGAIKMSLLARRFVAGTPPVLQVSSPTGGALVNGTTVWVAGTTEPGASLLVNGVVAAVAPDGDFGLLVAVHPGSNTIDVRATDRDGVTAELSVAVTGADVVGDLQGRLADAESALADAQGQLADEQARVDQLQEDLDAAQGALAAAEQDIASSAASLSALQGNLSAAQSQLTDSEAQVAALRDDLVATRAQLNDTLASHQSSIDSVSASAGTALGIGGLGVALGAVGVVAGLMLGRRGRGGATRALPDEPKGARRTS